MAVTTTIVNISASPVITKLFKVLEVFEALRGLEQVLTGTFSIGIRVVVTMATNKERIERLEVELESSLQPPDSIDESFIGASSVKHLPKHPNIVSLKDTYEDDIDVHIVIELCEGGELFDRIVTRRHYTERAAATVMKTIVEVVQHCGSSRRICAVSPNGSVSRSACGRSESSSTGNEHRRRNSLESLFCYDTPIPEERIEKSIGVSLSEKVIGDNPRCTECKAKGAVLCATCSSSGLYVDSILESQGIIVKVVGESVILCVLNVVAVVIVHLKKMANDEHLHKAFSFFDRNQSGFIEIKELRNALNDEVDTSSEDVINAIMHDVDTDKVSV
ncbi:hypothetical protein WN943_019138 [Citrus x changshan-huyou]